MKKTVLIFGVSSFVGSNLAQMLQDEFRVVGTYYKTPVEIPGITCLPCDVLRKDYVTNIVARIKPDITIYSVGLSSLKGAAEEPKLADALNTVGAINCCTASERYGSKFVLLSSCFVLGGEDTLYKEGDTPFPNTALGNSLSSSEFYVQRSCLNYFILRCSPLYGRSLNPIQENWFETVQASLAKGQKLLADDSVVTGFLDIYILSKILKAALVANVTNRLFQVSSRDWMSRFDFAVLYAKIFKKDETLIQRVAGGYPQDLSNKNATNESRHFFKLDTLNIEEFLGTKMPSIEESLRFTLERLSARP